LIRASLTGEEPPDEADELVESVVVYPVPGPLDVDTDRLGEVLDSFVFRRVRRPALRSAHEQRRAADPLPVLHRIRGAHPVR